jgi:hypothetical protein
MTDHEATTIAALMGLPMHQPQSTERNKDQVLQPPLDTHTGKGTKMAPDSSKRAAKKIRKKKDEIKFSLPPRVIQVGKIPKTHVDHSCGNFSIVPPEPGYRYPQ